MRRTTVHRYERSDCQLPYVFQPMPSTSCAANARQRWALPCQSWALHPGTCVARPSHTSYCQQGLLAVVANPIKVTVYLKKNKCPRSNCDNGSGQTQWSAASLWTEHDEGACQGSLMHTSGKAMLKHRALPIPHMWTNSS
jgi:hypothetical protein